MTASKPYAGLRSDMQTIYEHIASGAIRATKKRESAGKRKP